ncbi:MAG: T9SS type A sorting domain-containing protein [Bacteroidetes bacterium]|nr:T9SS type A sorting domain-containing protein [Bacteroidota bacterium]
MMKNFTLNSFSYIQKSILIVLIFAASAFTLPNTGNFNNIDGILQTRIIKCYPNPAISFVNFEVPAKYTSNGFSLQVYSFTGKKMFEETINSTKSTLNFNGDFYRGIYIYQMKDKNGKIIETGKFQVNK